uniref:FAD-binding FR-type domain-containing protein n=1 Tax=Palpitomonas bilix TaxID=652834 RepID=A0A7S3D6M3_9EUKA|mmetsp:Transcript_24585/g.62239  ORF Transcript_24585/g.62239 Transcript_24585/m.62239 type:complete len:648 (+) Transcript_24585:138-2081(+)
MGHLLGSFTRAEGIAFWILVVAVLLLILAFVVRECTRRRRGWKGGRSSRVSLLYPFLVVALSVSCYLITGIPLKDLFSDVSDLPILNVSKIFYSLSQSALPYAYYFIYFYVFTLIGMVAASLSQFSNLLQLPLRYFLPSSKFHEVTLGESIALFAYASFNLWWFAYFFLSINYASSVLELTARCFGHINALNLCVGMFFPTHHSLWSNIFAIPFTRAVKYHRWINRAAMMSILFHLTIWLADWTMKAGITNTLACIALDCRQTGVSFTAVAFAEIAFVMLLLGFVAAQEGVRRWKYEIFHALHFLNLVGLAFATLHSWVLVYLLPFPAALYIVDRIMKTISFQSKGRVVLLRVEEEEVTTMVIEMNSYFSYNPGQFVYIRVPSISSSQWHPFSICNPQDHAGDKCLLEFKIKSMGRNTFTGRLREKAKEIGIGNHGDALSIQLAMRTTRVDVEGPHGCAFSNVNHDVLVLIGGGVGATPLFCILRRVAAAAREGTLPYLYVHLLWVVKDPMCLTWFAEDMRDIERSFPKGKFGMQLHVTLKPRCDDGWKLRSTNGGSATAPLLTDEGNDEYVIRRRTTVVPPFRAGRPNISKLFVLITEHHRKPSKPCSVGIICSGPKTLKEETARLAMAFNDDKIVFNVHNETFRI